MVRFDRAREKRRAKFAYNLYKFRDHLGRKLSQNEAGIIKHKAAVAKYVKEYGPVQTNYEKVYFYILRGVDAENKRQDYNTNLMKKLAAAKIAEKKQLNENKKKRLADRQTERNERDARRIVKTYPRRIAGYEKRLKQAMRRRDQFQKTVDDLTPKLKTKEYKKLRGYKSYVKACERSAYWVIRFKKIIKGLESKLIPLQTALAAAQATLFLIRANPVMGVTTKKFTTNLQSSKSKTTNVKWQHTVKEIAKLKSIGPKSKQWVPVWSKSKHDKYRELQNIPTKCDVKKVVLIWYGAARLPELRIFGFNPHCILKTLLGTNVNISDIPVITIGSKNDYRITHSEHNRISN